jgi:hypothetical protein
MLNKLAAKAGALPGIMLLPCRTLLIFPPSPSLIGEEIIETDKHIEIIRSRLERHLRELRDSPVVSQGGLADALQSVLLELEGKESATAEPTGRSITLTELRQRLTAMPGARPILDAIDSAIADGAD